jgi:hypothetical protein
MSSQAWEHQGHVCSDHGGSAAKATGGSVNMPISAWLLPVLVVLAILSGASIGLTTFAFSQAEKADREARMLEYYLLELDAKFINAGLKDPAESIANKLKQQRERNP